MSARLDNLVHMGTWPAWLDRAREDGITPACDGATGLFFPDQGGVKQIAQAKAICHTPCPLLDTCRDWALQQHPQWLYGVWGGTSRGERIALAPRGEVPASLRKHNN